ncbi:histone H1oo isoform X2 [Fukomys damarensis]|uniref:histone H1oo isoform X2 n=1 Tax=Fukomys damarensis TaxID=885580 RepID=UPI0014555DEB|nr:histone H1oo isoform X2 [Fukomys damarensis]
MGGWGCVNTKSEWAAAASPQERWPRQLLFQWLPGASPATPLPPPPQWSHRGPLGLESQTQDSWDSVPRPHLVCVQGPPSYSTYRDFLVFAARLVSNSAQAILLLQPTEHPESQWLKLLRSGLSSSRVMVARRHPTVLRMVLEAVQAGEQHRGTSVAAIKLYILHKYPMVDIIRFKYLLKQALATGMRRGLLARPLNSKARGATGSFKLIPKHKKKPQSSKKRPQTGTASSSKKGASEPAQPRVPPRLAKALEKAPQGGRKAKGTRSQQDVAREGPSKPVGASSSVCQLDRKSKVLGSQGRKGDTGAPGTTAAVAPKLQSGTTIMATAILWQRVTLAMHWGLHGQVTGK